MPFPLLCILGSNNIIHNIVAINEICNIMTSVVTELTGTKNANVSADTMKSLISTGMY